MNVLTIARRELGAYFHSPVAYLVLALFLLLQGAVFWILLGYLQLPHVPPGAVMSYFFGGTLLFWLSVLLAVSILPMRLLAEERRSGTLETLMTAPLRETELVLGKYFACLIFYVVLWLPEVLYVAVLWYLGGRPDLGPIAAGYLGCFLVGAALLAWGLFASALTRNQIVAAALGFAFSLALLLLGIVQELVPSPAWKEALAHVHLFRMMEDFGKGIVDSRHVVLLASLAGVGLYATVKVVELGKGR